MKVPFTVSYTLGGHKSTQFSSETSRNVYFSSAEANGRIGAHDFPGLLLRATGTGAGRGEHVMGGVRYVINGSTLYSEAEDGARTSLGIVGGADRAIFADDGTNLYFVADNSLYKYDGTLSIVTVPVVTNVSAIAYINRQFIVSGDNGLFGTSDVADGSSYNALNYAEAETKPDALLRPYVFNQLVYMLGADSTEPWYNSGIGNPPFDRQDTALVNVGIAGKYAVANTNQYLYWLGNDRKIYQCIGSSARPINSSGVSEIISAFDSVSDCVASAFDLKGQDFILFKFPSNNCALLYSETNNYWGELSSGTDVARASWYGDAVSKCYEKNLVTDFRNGNTYELDFNTYTDNGDTRLRVFQLPPVTGDAIGAPDNQITVSGATIFMQTGVGLSLGQGSDPVIMCEFSQEGGEIYGAQSHVSIGVMGEYKKKVRFDDFATGYQINMRLMCSDPVPLTIWGGVLDVMDAGY